MQVTALLTARGNNTLRDKNILPVLGRPLLSYPAKAAKRSELITDFYVSSDCGQILGTAEQIGYESIVRPPELATPTSQHADTIIHSLEEIEKRTGSKPDILVVLLGNTATIKTEWIDACIRQLLDDPSIDAAVPCYVDNDHHPFRAKTIGGDGMLETFIDFTGKQISTNRQDLPKCVFLCHNFWVLNVQNSVLAEGGQKPWQFMGNRVFPLIIPETLDVHCSEDLARMSEWLIEHGRELLDDDQLLLAYSRDDVGQSV